jgi:phosphonate transport system substrate-binding protein
MADYLAAHLAAYGYTAGVVKVAPDPQTMAIWLKTGQVDLDFDSLYPALVVSSGSGAQPFLRRWKGGNPEYHTMFVARADSGIRSMADLKGHVIGFEDPFSTSGYFMPKSLLVRLQMKSAEATGPDASMPADTVGYVFTKEATSTIQWMLSGKLQAGAVDNWAYDALPAETKARLVILDQTEDVTRHVAMIRLGIDPEVFTAIKGLLLTMDQTPEGRQVLAGFEQTAKFDAGTLSTDLTHLRELLTLVNG